MKKIQKKWKNFIRTDDLELRFKPEISEVQSRCPDSSTGTQKHVSSTEYF
jgi:hypothetical protein